MGRDAAQGIRLKGAPDVLRMPERTVGRLRAESFEFANPEFVARYVENGPAGFIPCQPVVLETADVLLAERAPRERHILIVGAGGGLDTPP